MVSRTAAAFIAALAITSAPALAQAPGPEVCANCHADYAASFHASKHGTKTDPRAPVNKGACAICHGDGTEHVKAGGGRGVGGIRNLSSKMLPAEEKSRICLTCHQGGSRIHWQSNAHSAREVSCSNCHKVHAAQDAVRDKVVQSEVCFSCHKEQRAQIMRPSRHPIQEGLVACSDCHNPHGSAGEKMLVRDSVNDTCYTCHMEKRGPFVRSHQPVQENCAICHNPHGTTNPTLLKIRMPFLCQSCHQPSSHHATIPQNGQVIGNPTTAQSVIMARGCTNCHTNIHGSNNAQDGSGRGFRR
jgi:DmsE family decaheme c-type cytochrome